MPQISRLRIIVLLRCHVAKLVKNSYAVIHSFTFKNFMIFLLLYVLGAMLDLIILLDEPFCG